MRVIIFGAKGQDGFYLRHLLERKNIETICISRTPGEFANVCGDVADWKFVEKAIQNYKPEYIFHFAANSTTRHEAIFENHAAVSTGTINILEAVYRHSRRSKVFLSGSAMQFENEGQPINEMTPFAPLSSYAVSRIHSVYAGRYYRSLTLKVYVGYFFNHDSPRRTEQHVNQKIVRAVKRIAQGSSEKIEIGDPSVKKEFNFAGDIIKAVWQLVNQDETFEAVIGNGEAHSISEWLDLCFAGIGKDWRDYVTIKENFKPEYRILVSNPARIKSLGWRPKVNINGLAKLMMGK
jgi:GDPmannose 4,6-dehydratase